MEKWLQSRHVMVELSLLCSISQIFLKSSLCRKTTVNPPHDTSLRKQWETHLLPAATISVRASGRTSLHNWFFRAFARQFVIYLNAPQWRSSQTAQALLYNYLFLHLLHFLCATGLRWGNRSLYVDDDLGDDTTLQWPGHGTTSCKAM